MKRLTLILWLLLSTTVCTFAYDFQFGDLYYNITSDSTVEVTYQSYRSDYAYNYLGLTSTVIPKLVTYNGITYRVTSIGESAFKGCSGLASVTILNSITSIGWGAFYGCSGLTSVTIPNSVTSIGWRAFSGCSGLTSVTIPNSVTSIGGSAFYGCGGLISVIIPNGITSIEYETFRDCSRLTSITIGCGVTSVEESAFRDCRSLTSVVWNAKNCADFTNGSTPFYVYATYSGFDLRPQITSFIFGDSVQHIPAYICYGMEKLTSITLQNGITSIGEAAFGDCSGLASVTILNSITSIGWGAFYGCSGLTSVTIPNSVTSIGGSAFYGCSGLTSVTMPNSLTNLGASAFRDCSELTAITIPNGITSIGELTFYGCSGLTTITIPNSVTSIGNAAFFGCSNLEAVIFGSGVQNIDKNAFTSCKGIYEMTVYATKVPNISEGTFSDVSNWAELHVPAESVKKYRVHPEWGKFNVITAVPYMVTLLCDNMQGAVMGSGSYQPNEQITITAKPNTGYRFVQWSDGITTNPRTIVVASDTTLTAEFEEIPASEYTVSIVVDPTQHGTVQMTLTAVPDEGYQFTQWSDGNTENPRTILVTENITLSATFVLSGITTEYSNASAEESQDGTRKVFRNGQVYIIRGDKTYTLTGEEVK